MAGRMMPKLEGKTGREEKQMPREGLYGVHDVMTYGLAATRDNLTSSHPLEKSEKNYFKTLEEMEMNAARRHQGNHMPLVLHMERRSAMKVGHLSFLPRSNLMHDVLTGRDSDVGFEDYLNPAEFREVMGQPHAVMEKQLGLL